MADSGLKKEPMFRIAKRSDISRKKAVIIRIIAFLLALVVCGVFVFVLTKENPLSVYMGMVDGAVGTPRRTWNTLRDTMILLSVALAITPALRCVFGTSEPKDRYLWEALPQRR